MRSEEAGDNGGGAGAPVLILLLILIFVPEGPGRESRDKGRESRARAGQRRQSIVDS